MVNLPAVYGINRKKNKLFRKKHYGQGKEKMLKYEQ